MARTLVSFFFLFKNVIPLALTTALVFFFFQSRTSGEWEAEVSEVRGDGKKWGGEPDLDFNALHFRLLPHSLNPLIEQKKTTGAILLKVLFELLQL